MDAQEFVERRSNYGEEKRRMEDRILDKLIDLGERISSMEATQETLIKRIDKYNNLGSRVLSLEEYRERCTEEHKIKRFPWNAVLVGLLVGIGTVIMDYFIG